MGHDGVTGLPDEEFCLMVVWELWEQLLALYVPDHSLTPPEMQGLDCGSEVLQGAVIWCPELEAMV